jgi:hypothetical protein
MYYRRIAARPRADCRGVNTPAEFTRQRDKLLAALTGLNADIIGLTSSRTRPVPTLASIVAGLPGYRTSTPARSAPRDQGRPDLSPDVSRRSGRTHR